MKKNDVELWDVYDKDRNMTGRLHERGKPMATGEYHIIVHVWKYNAQGEWLIDKRAVRYGNDDIDGKWETTGGCAVAGDDSLTAALREAKEELGIELNPQNGTLHSSMAHQWDNGHTAFIDVWIFYYNEPIEKITVEVSEVSDAMWASVDKIKEMMANGEMLEYSYFDEMVTEMARFTDMQGYSIDEFHSNMRKAIEHGAK